MIAEVLTGIALVQKSVEFIKSNISTVQDISQIAGQIDALFTGQKQVNEARNKKSGVGITDQFGVDSVAREVIDAKIAAEKLQEVATMVDMRFGPGTWKGILEERQKRIQQAKEAAAEARRQKLQEAREVEELIKQIVLVSTVVVATIGFFVLLFTIIL